MCVCVCVCALLAYKSMLVYSPTYTTTNNKKRDVYKR